MIGIFGLRRAAPSAPADPAAMARTLGEARFKGRYFVSAKRASGAALGFVAHRSDNTKRAASADGRWSSTLAGEIYNLGSFADLDPPPLSAAELLLRLFMNETPDRLADINGQYCAAVYDAASHRLILVTDRIASFPLHVWMDRGEVRFATQLHTLLGDRRVARKADFDGLAQLFSLHRTVGAATNISGVRALRGATVWECAGGAMRERRYWELRWRKPDFNRRGAAELLAQALSGAVARQGMTNGSGAALLLSGGVDSRLVLAAAGDRPPQCWTTASFEGARELEVARGVAALVGAPHRTAIVDPARTLDCLEDAVVESNGLYPASTPIAAFVPEVAREGALAFTGHGLDYTIRGMYLPYRRARIGRSMTRLPSLLKLPHRLSGGFVLRNLRHGPTIAVVDRIVLPRRRGDWWARLEAALDRELEPWLASDNPANAWDALIVQSVSKHYTFTGMMSVRAHMDLAITTFDNEVFDLYLRLPPAWRADRRIAQGALRILSRTAAAYQNANTGHRADLNPWLELAAVVGGAALRRLGIRRPSALPSPSHSHGSWQNTPKLFRDDPGYRQRFLEIRDRLDALSLGILDPDALAAGIDEHLDGRADHTKILRYLLTHDVWVRKFGIEGIA